MVMPRITMSAQRKIYTPPVRLRPEL